MAQNTKIRFKLTEEQYFEIKQLLSCGWFFDPPLPMEPNYRTITDIFNEKYRVPHGLTPLPRGLIATEYYNYNSKKTLKRMLTNGILSLVPGPLVKLVSSPFKSKDRFVFNVEHLSYSGPEAVPQVNVENHIERQQIRSILNRFVGKEIKHAVEIGCGFGRLTMVLSEYAREVYGFEREKHLVEIARTLLPDIEFRQIETLTDLGMKDGYFDFAMSVTVLQHINNEEVQAILKETKRVVGKGYILLIEKTDPSDCYGNLESKDEFISVGRLPEQYQEWMKPFKLVHIEDREMVPTYFRKKAFSAMLFKSP